MKQHSVKPLQTDGLTLKQGDDFSVLVRYGCCLAAQVTKEAHGCLVNRAVCFQGDRLKDAEESEYLADFLSAASSAIAPANEAEYY